MLQIVFSDSECGSLKMATHCRPSRWNDGLIGFIFGDGEKEPTQEDKDQVMAQLKAIREKENRRAQPVGGNPEDVLWQLRDFDCPVTALKLPRWMPLGDDSVQSCLTWGELSPGDWAAYLPLEREIPKNVRKAIAMEWLQLREENSPLRAVVNGRLRSVGEDFYDPFIRAQIPDGIFRVAHLIGDVLGRYQLGIGDWWIAKRIQAMESQGELITVSKGDGFYRDKMRRAQ